MYSLFADNPAYSAGGISHWPEFNLIRRIYIKELQVLQNYYHNRVYSVKSNHLLVNLLNILSVPMQYSNQRYVEVCRDRADTISRSLEITSETHYGKLHDGVFYGPGCTEILYSVDEYFDIDYVVKNWKDMISVRPLLHPKSDLKLLLPNGKKSSSEEGLATIAINIPMLALQYKCFSIEQYNNLSKTGSLLGATHFIHMYILPNMIGPQLDITIMNRLVNLFYGIPMGEGYLRHVFRISDYSQRIDSILTKVLYRLSTDRMSFQLMLENIPTIFNNNMSVALQMPNYQPTRQVWWSLILSRLMYMKLLIDIGIVRSDNSNLNSIHNLQIELKRLLREHVYNSELSSDILYDTELTINQILNL
jgi:hypothetical protein